MSFIIIQDWSLRKQISEPSCKEFSLNVKVLSAESLYLNSRVMVLYCHTMILYHSVVLLYHNVVLLYFLYGDSDTLELKIQLSSLISMKTDELQVLQLFYFYRHLNSVNLNSLSTTDLILHWAQLMSETKLFSEKVQFCWAPHKKWWL